MDDKKFSTNLFANGSIWLRADFHLHTLADKEFKYSGEKNNFITDYVARLKATGIRLGVITNHNKFDEVEFRELRRKAHKEGIYLLPGVELSVNDGASGIHLLIIFSESWLENGDYISPAITSMFPGKAELEFQNENGRSDKAILQVVEELNKTSRDYFMIFAHVEQKCGLWAEMSGGRFEDFKSNRYKAVREKTLGFQKVRTRDERESVKQWLGGWYPAEVEGSDCKSIDEIGNGNKVYVKLGAFSFDAIKFSLIDKENRIAREQYQYKHSYIRTIRFTGGTLSGEELHFSPELNTLIGIRGSGKSSIIEVLRYALGMALVEDQDYKESLVGFTMGSGGKVEVDAVDRYGQPYTVRRVWKEAYSDVLIQGKLHPGVSICETVIHKPIYFGQKDLSKTGAGFEKDLVDKLLGSKLNEIRHEIAQQKRIVAEAIDRLTKITNVQDQIVEQRKIKQDAEHCLTFYAEHGLEQKLQKRLDYDNDVKIMRKGVELTEHFISDLEIFLAQHEDDMRNYVGYHSKHNAKLFEEFYAQYHTYIALIDQVKTWLNNIKASKQSLVQCQLDMDEIRKGMVEEFAEIERKLGDELKSRGSQNISSDDFLILKRKLNTATQAVAALEKQSDQKKAFENMLLVELSRMNDLWLREFNLIKGELDKVGSGSSYISITSEYKEDKEAFLAFMKDVFKGSGIRENTYKGISDRYPDFIEIYKDFENAKSLFGSNPHILTELFLKNLKTLLTYQTPNKYTILYRNKELKHHSLGQRASALILFVLSQKENDLIIIDQPEDDLDNQTIYEDVIKLIREMKHKVQFIFATHNPNIPVLGDAEQVHACSFMDDRVSVESGSVDNPGIQRKIIEIMEGGQEAFNRRKEIYQIWKP